MELLPILQQIFPTVTAYETLSSVVQANAEGHRLRLESVIEIDENVKDDRNNRMEEVFVKLVSAKKYTHKSWTDLRRTLMYMRTEVRFYKEMLPALHLKGFQATPDIYLADYNFDGLLHEEEAATDQSTAATTTTTTTTTAPQVCEADVDGNVAVAAAAAAEGFLIMESIQNPSYFQDSPLTLDQAKECLTAVAGLHAAAWEDNELLTKAQSRLSRGSYHLKIRNPKELAGMEKTWDEFRTNFYEQDSDLFDRTKDLGTRMYNLATYISNEISPGPNDTYATLAHGDYKAMNVFLPTDGAKSRGPLIVDFASIGVGLGMSDVAMHIHHAVKPDDLANGGEEDLVHHYLEVLHEKLGSNLKYPKEVALRHYRLAVADYFRFVLGRFWKSANLESFEKKKDSKNTVLVNRNVKAALAFIDRVDGYLQLIEQERRSNRK